MLRHDRAARPHDPISVCDRSIDSRPEFYHEQSIDTRSISDTRRSPKPIVGLTATGNRLYNEANPIGLEREDGLREI